MTLETILASLNSGPVWAFAGVVATKLVDWLVARSASSAAKAKASSDYTVQMQVATNASHQLLVESLFENIKSLKGDVDKLKALYEEERTARIAAEQRYAELEARLVLAGISPRSASQEETGPHD